ncbi:hypothetical protein N7G274_009974 [Stereocaulon virgatum]|uniref:Uncharacterized protein n=1 Tax=Stereocaulon virgatum TaxID=373712 RepID=A0ABR3ZVV4_9LECA
MYNKRCCPVSDHMNNSALSNFTPVSKSGRSKSSVLTVLEGLTRRINIPPLCSINRTTQSARWGRLCTIAPFYLRAIHTISLSAVLTAAPTFHSGNLVRVYSLCGRMCVHRVPTDKMPGFGSVTNGEKRP